MRFTVLISCIILLFANTSLLLPTQAFLKRSRLSSSALQDHGVAAHVTDDQNHESSDSGSRASEKVDESYYSIDEPVLQYESYSIDESVVDEPVLQSMTMYPGFLQNLLYFDPDVHDKILQLIGLVKKRPLVDKPPVSEVKPSDIGLCETDEVDIEMMIFQERVESVVAVCNPMFLDNMENIRQMQQYGRPFVSKSDEIAHVNSLFTRQLDEESEENSENTSVSTMSNEEQKLFIIKTAKTELLTELYYKDSEKTIFSEDLRAEIQAAVLQMVWSQ